MYPCILLMAHTKDCALQGEIELNRPVIYLKKVEHCISSLISHHVHIHTRIHAYTHTYTYMTAYAFYIPRYNIDFVSMDP